MVTSTRVIRPDFEVNITNASGEAVLVAGLFIDEAGVVDIGIGWDGETEIPGVRAILESVAVALEGIVSWVAASDLAGENSKRKTEGDQIPF